MSRTDSHPTCVETHRNPNSHWNHNTNLDHPQCSQDKNRPRQRNPRQISNKLHQRSADSPFLAVSILSLDSPSSAEVFFKFKKAAAEFDKAKTHLMGTKPSSTTLNTILPYLWAVHKAQIPPVPSQYNICPSIKNTLKQLNKHIQSTPAPAPAPTDHRKADHSIRWRIPSPNLSRRTSSINPLPNHPKQRSFENCLRNIA